MAKVNFENLRIYALPEQLADRIWESVSRWDGFAKDTVGKQLVRAADSIGANIAEGSGREEVLRITGVFSEYLAALSMKPCTGFAELICANC